MIVKAKRKEIIVAPSAISMADRSTKEEINLKFQSGLTYFYVTLTKEQAEWLEGALHNCIHEKKASLLSYGDDVII